MPDRDDRYESGLDDELIDLRTDLQSALARAERAEAQEVELERAVENLLNTPMNTEEWDQAMNAVGETYDALQAARSGRGEGEG